MLLFAIRHPQPLVGADVCYGSTDVGVVPASLSTLTNSLAAVLPNGLAMYSSPLQRCTALATQLALRLESASPTLDVRLVELHFGTWELRSWTDISHNEVNAWAANTVNYRPGNGESLIEMAQRIFSFRADVQAKGQDSIVVCHAGTLRLLLAAQHCATPALAAAWAAAHPLSFAWGHLQQLEL